MLHKLPDEIYKLIMSYIFVPKVHLHRYCGDKWNSDLFINKCYICRQNAKKVALAYNCGCNYLDESTIWITKCKDGCKNQLICFSCAH